MINIPILAYHKISNVKEFGLTTLGCNAFESQIRNLVSEGYKAITFKDLLKGNSVSQKSVIIAFDDGYESVYQNAFPILHKYNVPANLFLVVNYIGKYNHWESFSIQKKHRHLSNPQILELQKYGFEIGSHTLNHYYLPSCQEDVVRKEMEVSKKKLEDITGESVISFCFPYGKYDQKSLDIVSESGYKFATCNIQLFSRKNNHSFNFPRRTIYATDSMRTFIKKLKYSQEINSIYLAEWVIQLGAWASIWKKHHKNI